MLGVVEIDLDRAWRGSLDVAMQDLEQATRNAVHEAGQRVIDARVVPGELAGKVLVDIRFSGDRAGALAAFERWKATVPDVAGGSVILRTLLRGADVNLEWSDDEYDKELQARERSAEPGSPRQLAAQRPDTGSRPAGSWWLTDWQEAARHPWKARLFLIAGFALLGVIFAPLTGHLALGSLAVAAGLSAAVGAAMGEYAMRAMRRPGAGDGRS